MAFNVLELLREDGLEPSQVTPEPEYQGACPGCGGNDRFCVWPEQNQRDSEGQARGSYHCGHGHGGNGCGKSGDNIQYLRDFRGMSYRDACAYLGLDTAGGNDRRPPASRAYRSPTPPPSTTAGRGFTPGGGEHPPEVLDPDTWRAHAEKFVARCHQELLANEKTLAYLAGRGINRESVIRYRLGLHRGKVRKGVQAEPDYRPLTAWGMQNKPRPNGRPGVFVLPAGIVIPWADDRGLHTVQVRLFKPDPKNPKKKYHFVKGSAVRTLVLRPEAPVQMPIETVLDAILVDQFAGDLVGAIALGASGYHPSPAADRVLRRSARILQALDYDQAGAKVRNWWAETYPQTRRWPTPVGKDPGEAWKEGVDLRAWITAGLPAGLRPGVTIPHPPAAAPVKKIAGEQQDLADLQLLLTRSGSIIRITGGGHDISLLHDDTFRHRHPDQVKRISSLVFQSEEVNALLAALADGVYKADDFRRPVLYETDERPGHDPARSPEPRVPHSGDRAETSITGE